MDLLVVLLRNIPSPPVFIQELELLQNYESLPSTSFFHTYDSVQGLSVRRFRSPVALLFIDDFYALLLFCSMRRYRCCASSQPTKADRILLIRLWSYSMRFN